MEFSQTVSQFFERHSDRCSNCNSCQCVQNIMHAWNFQLDTSENFLIMLDFEFHSRSIRFYVDCSKIRRMIDCVCYQRRFDISRNITKIFAVEANHSTFRTFDEFFECGFDIFNTAVMVKMIIFDIRHDCNIRLQFQKRSVTFISLGNQKFTASEFGIRAEIRRFAADYDRR